MAKLDISEYASSGFASGGVTALQIGREPCILDQTPVTFSIEAKSAAFNAETHFIRVWSDTNCCIKFGSSPTASTSNKPLAAQSPEYFGVKPGDKVSVIAL